MKKIKIISLSQAKAKGKYEVVTSGETYKWHEDTIIKFLVLKDKLFTTNEIELIVNYDYEVDAFSKALKYISFQQRSTNEVIENLKKSNYNQAIITRTIEKLTELKFLDDERFAENTLNYCINTKKGPFVLERKLKEKKVNEQIIKTILQEYTYDIQKDVIAEIVRKQSSNAKLPIKKQQANLYSKIIRDGFNQELATYAIGQVKFVDESDDALIEQILKLKRKYNELDKKTQKNKILSSLMQKGFEYSKIIKNLDE